MAATTNCHSSLPIIFLLAIFVHILEAYKPVAVKIDLNPSGKPAKVFTKDSIAEFDASEVRGLLFFSFVTSLFRLESLYRLRSMTNTGTYTAGE